MLLEKIVAACRIVLPHVGLIAFLVIYIVSGAAVFYALEKPREEAVRKEADEKQRELRRSLLTNISQLTEQDGIDKEQFDGLADLLLDDYIKQMMHSFAQPYEYRTDYSPPSDTWTFSSAISFAAITLVTVGMIIRLEPTSNLSIAAVHM